MQFILDNLIASIVTGIIILIIFSMRIRTQDTTVDALNHYALTKQELDFIEMLKKDLHGVARVDSVGEYIDLSSDTSFTFWAQQVPSDTTKVQIKYKRTKVGERDGEGLFQIQRYQSGTYDGGSMITVTDWKIEARNIQGGSITMPDDAGQIYVRFEAVPPFRKDEKLERTRWEATFHPPLLREDMLL